jgi:hypothetical protein
MNTHAEEAHEHLNTFDAWLFWVFWLGSGNCFLSFMILFLSSDSVQHFLKSPSIYGKIQPFAVFAGPAFAKLACPGSSIFELAVIGFGHSTTSCSVYQSSNFGALIF